MMNSSLRVRKKEVNYPMIEKDPGRGSIGIWGKVAKDVSQDVSQDVSHISVNAGMRLSKMQAVITRRRGRQREKILGLLNRQEQIQWYK